ncbi:hypothetical protein JAAARDRAFT_51487 [Jaapia argillacea MUCL 33604]|uniref:Uncharacterized protein n=1 Tax=Jaapia argillacea MUCL 33604 TaxID=933084 RepID=A0A067P884_9AGAM|nr:hypothetical protein JAAARDRAFT_51487 [Jaapia argillacea MUCL 33604]
MKKYSKKISKEFDVAFPHNKPARIFDTKDGQKVAVGEETEAEALARTATRPKQIYNWIRNHWKKCRPDAVKSLPKSLQLQSIPVTTTKRASSARDLFQRDHPQIAQEVREALQREGISDRSTVQLQTNAAVTRAMDLLKETDLEKWEECSSDPSFNLTEVKTRTALDQLCNHLVSHFESNPVMTGTTSLQELTEDISESELDENNEPDVSQAAEGSKGDKEQKAEEEAREEAVRKAGEEARKEAARIAEEEVSKEAEGVRMVEEEVRKQAARMAEEEARKEVARTAEEQASKEAEAARMAEEEALKVAERKAEQDPLKAVTEADAKEDGEEAQLGEDVTHGKSTKGKKTGGRKKKVVAEKKSTDTNVQDTNTGGRRASGRLKRPHEPDSKKPHTRSAGKPVPPTKPSVSGAGKIRIPPRLQAAAKSSVTSFHGRGHGHIFFMQSHSILSRYTMGVEVDTEKAKPINTSIVGQRVGFDIFPCLQQKQSSQLDIDNVHDLYPGLSADYRISHNREAQQLELPGPGPSSAVVEPQTPCRRHWTTTWRSPVLEASSSPSIPDVKFDLHSYNFTPVADDALPLHFACSTASKQLPSIVRELETMEIKRLTTLAVLDTAGPSANRWLLSGGSLEREDYQSGVICLAENVTRMVLPEPAHIWRLHVGNNFWNAKAGEGEGGKLTSWMFW